MWGYRALLSISPERKTRIKWKRLEKCITARNQKKNKTESREREREITMVAASAPIRARSTTLMVQAVLGFIKGKCSKD